MAAITITSVRPTASTGAPDRVIYGATLGVGVPVYKLASDGEHYAADCDASSATKSVKGITITEGVNGGYGYIVSRGTVEFPGASMTEGTTYFLGPTAGQIVEYSDLSSGDDVVRMGTAVSATEFKLSIEDTGATKP